mgnify:FL=1
MIKNILVTGNLGYIGTVLTKFLAEKNYNITGYDNGFYESNLFGEIETKPQIQIKKDIRDLKDEDLSNIDCVIHLAGLSNDPLGEFNKSLTYEINLKGTVNLAKISRTNGVKRFIYISSQSMYGISESAEELDEDLSEKNPITTYAKAKWEAEKEINEISNNNFTVVSFRPSTVFGWSPRLRCDIVFNNLVASAYTENKIVVFSDGSPWRPVIHIRDVCSAIYAGIVAPSNLVNNKSYNIGVKNGNYTVKEMAEVVREIYPKTEVIFKNKTPDSRTYKVSFKRILSELSNYYKPSWDLKSGAKELIENFDKFKFTKDDFQGTKTNRIQQLKYLQNQGYLTNGFRLTK